MKPEAERATKRHVSVRLCIRRRKHFICRQWRAIGLTRSRGSATREGAIATPMKPQIWDCLGAKHEWLWLATAVNYNNADQRSAYRASGHDLRDAPRPSSRNQHVPLPVHVPLGCGRFSCVLWMIDEFALLIQFVRRASCVCTVREDHLVNCDDAFNGREYCGSSDKVANGVIRVGVNRGK